MCVVYTVVTIFTCSGNQTPVKAKVCVKVFDSFVKDLGRDIYDLYAEYAEEEEDPFAASPSRLLLPPDKQLILNINVGGTVTLLSFHRSVG